MAAAAIAPAPAAAALPVRGSSGRRVAAPAANASASAAAQPVVGSSGRRALARVRGGGCWGPDVALPQDGLWPARKEPAAGDPRRSRPRGPEGEGSWPWEGRGLRLPHEGGSELRPATRGLAPPVFPSCKGCHGGAAVGCTLPCCCPAEQRRWGPWARNRHHVQLLGHGHARPRRRACLSSPASSPQSCCVTSRA